jgi:hypothetical protein
MPMEPVQVSDFRSVEKPSPDGSKNGKLSYSHVGFDASTDKNGGNGAREGFATSEAPVCGNAATAGNGQRDSDVTAADAPSTVPPGDALDNPGLHDDGLDIPTDLARTKGNGPHTWRAVPSDRRPALGPPGDSLDDFK